MLRLWFCLPVCLLLATDRGDTRPTAQPTPQAQAEPLPEADPVTFLEKCLQRYDQRGVRGYRLIFHKQERLNGELQPSEEIEVFFREQPHSVFLRWLRGQRRANSVLYVEGENDGMMLANPAGLAGRFVKVVARDPEGEEARQSGRYSLKEFGLKKTAQRTLRACKAAREKGTLRLEYLGVRQVREAGDRWCYSFRRTCSPVEGDGVAEVLFYIDKETGVQVGSSLKGAAGQLIGDYFYRDIQFNPEFKPNQFDRSALTP